LELTVSAQISLATAKFQTNNAVDSSSKWV
jgi:hypothetical protein